MPPTRKCSSRCCAQAFTLWLQSAHFGRHGNEVVQLIRELLQVNPFTTLQVVLEPTEKLTSEAVQREVGPRLWNELLAVCLANPTYLDKYYALQPGRPNGAKRLIVLLPLSLRKQSREDQKDRRGIDTSQHGELPTSRRICISPLRAEAPNYLLAQRHFRCRKRLESPYSDCALVARNCNSATTMRARICTICCSRCECVN